MSGKTRGYTAFDAVTKSIRASAGLAEEMQKQLDAFLAASEKLAGTWSGPSREKFVKIYPQIAETWKSCRVCLDELAEFVQKEGQQEYNKMQRAADILKIKE